MVEDAAVDATPRTDAEPNPVALSLAGGAVGTIGGLRRGGLPGAVAGGLVGGTVGYLAGAVSCETTRSSGTVDSGGDPIEITPFDDGDADASEAGSDDSDDSADDGAAASDGNAE
jgi:hypothetical protein